MLPVSASEKSLPQLPSASVSSILLETFDESDLSYSAESGNTSVSVSPQQTLRLDPRRKTGDFASPRNGSVEMLNEGARSSTQSLVRRRTMLIPGLATRGQPSNVLRKPPPQEYVQTQADRDFYYNSAISEDSWLARPPTLGLDHEGRQSPASLRALTPCDLDYSHLAGLRRGTLRITNGTASPSPSLTISRHRAHSIDSQDEVEHTLTFDEEYSGEVSLPHRSLEPSINKALPLPLAESDPFEDRDSSSFLDHRSSPPITHPPYAEATADARGAEKPFRVATPEVHEDRCAHSFGYNQPSPDRASQMAGEYMNELPSSPFFSSPPSNGSPLLLATSKVSPEEDGLFDDEGVAASFTGRDFLDEVGEAFHGEDTGGSREDAFQILEGGLQRLPSLNCISDVRPSTPTTPSPSEKRPKDAQATDSKSPAKPDSGYSSHASLPSSEAAAFNGPARGQELQEPLKIGSLVQPSRAAPPLPPKPIIRTRATVESLPPPVPPKKDKQKFRKSAPALDPMPPSASETVPTPARTPPLNRKLRKARPLSQPSFAPAAPIAVQNNHDISHDQIPPVPSDVAARLAERLRDFPALEHTYPSLQHTSSRDDASLLGSEPLTLEPCLQGRGQADAAMRGRLGQFRASMDLRPNQKRSNSSSPQVPMQRKRDRQEPDWHLPSITDFGTVAESLGASPYDIATRAFGHETSRSSPQLSKHPHQIGAMSRARTMKGMDEESAAAFAREKSRDCGKVRARSTSRPRTMYESLAVDGRAATKAARPKSMVATIPPVPSLPAPKQSQKQDNVTKTEDQGVGAASGPRTPERPTVSAKSVTFEDQQQSWETYRKAWRARRKSASEGLKASSRTNRERGHQSAESPREGRKVSMSHRASVENYFAPYDGANSATNTSLPNSESSIGRHDGGFGFNYEPGIGFGGSAGTRSPRDSASRKSVAISQKYGVDLSDVPIFVHA